MAKFGNSLKSGGYDQEEAHFHKIEQELIEKVRSETKKESHLKLVQGGKKDSPQEEMLLPRGQTKKAA